MLQGIRYGGPAQEGATRLRGQTGRFAARPPGPRGGDAVRTLARFAARRPLEASTSLFAR